MHWRWSIVSKNMWKAKRSDILFIVTCKVLNMSWIWYYYTWSVFVMYIMGAARLCLTQEWEFCGLILVWYHCISPGVVHQHGQKQCFTKPTLRMVRWAFHHVNTGLIGKLVICRLNNHQTIHSSLCFTQGFLVGSVISPFSTALMMCIYSLSNVFKYQCVVLLLALLQMLLCRSSWEKIFSPRY